MKYKINISIFPNSFREKERRGESEKNVTYVDMQPEPVLLADIGNLWDRIERTNNCRSRRGVHKEWYMTSGLALQD